MNSKRLFSLSVLMITFSLFAVEVNKSELEKTYNDSTIEFINYTGPHKIIESIQSIRGIGSSIGQNISKNTTEGGTFGNEKYSVIHAVDENQKDKLDADIIVIGKSATVDHITNLRRIISGYLVSAYNYSEADADTLSVFITVYNAVYRGKIDTFTEKYKDIVIQSISEESCGLSVNYKDWPGNSQIIIPLYDIRDGGLSTIETSVISDTQVVKSMKEDDDRNIDSRKEMVDLKERESDEAEEKAQAAQKEAVAEQKKLNEEKQKTQEAITEAETAKKEAEDARKEAVDARKAADENPDDEEAQTAAVEAENMAEEKAMFAQEKEEELEDQKQKESEQQIKVIQAKEEAKEKQAVADKKQTEAQSERKEIAKDQQIVQKEEERKAASPYSFGIILTDDKAVLSRLVKFNTETGEILKSSPVTVIRNRTVFNTEEGFIAIAGENSAKGAVRLIVLDSEKMEIINESDFIVAENSVLVQDGSDYYCIISENKKFFVVKVDDTLTVHLKSQIEVKESTPITVTDKGIVVTDTKGKLKLLSKNSLSEVSKN